VLAKGRQFLFLIRHPPIFAGRNPYPFFFINFIKIKTKLTNINLHVIRFNHCRIIHVEEFVLAIQNMHGLVESLVYRSLKIPIHRYIEVDNLRRNHIFDN